MYSYEHINQSRILLNYNTIKSYNKAINNRLNFGISGDLAPWVLNAAGRMLEDGQDIRGSLDDFYTMQNANGGLEIDNVMNDSLNNSPRKMQPVSDVYD